MTAVAKTTNFLASLAPRSKSDRVKARPVSGKHSQVVASSMEYVSRKHGKTLEELAKV